MGNHDFGNADPEGLCPFFAPRVTCPGAESGCGGAKPFSNQSQQLGTRLLGPRYLGIGCEASGQATQLPGSLKLFTTSNKSPCAGVWSTHGRASQGFRVQITPDSPRTYAFNQLNVDKGGIGGDVRTNFHAPDFTYYCTIPDLDYVSWSPSGSQLGAPNAERLKCQARSLLTSRGANRYI